MTDNENDWIRKSLEGDHDAFESLIRRYQHMIYTLAYRMSGSAADAEDLTQETFIRAHEKLSGFRTESRFSTWLYRLAINQCLNWRKRTQRRERLHADWEAQREIDLAPDDIVIWQVQSALLQLNPKQRAAVVLTIYDGMTHAEAASVLGTSETTVSWRLFSARTKLKRLLESTKQRYVDE